MDLWLTNLNSPTTTAHCRNLANTTEPSVCGGDAALPYLTLPYLPGGWVLATQR